MKKIILVSAVAIGCAIVDINLSFAGSGQSRYDLAICGSFNSDGTMTVGAMCSTVNPNGPCTKITKCLNENEQ